MLESLGRSAVSGRWTHLPKRETKRIDGGSPIASPMPKSIHFGGRKDQLLRVNFLRTFHRWGDLVFIVDVFPNWMVIRILSYWMGDFISLSLSD